MAAEVLQLPRPALAPQLLLELFDELRDLAPFFRGPRRANPRPFHEAKP